MSFLKEQKWKITKEHITLLIKYPIMPENAFHKLLDTLMRAISLRSHATRLSFSGTPARSLFFSLSSSPIFCTLGLASSSCLLKYSGPPSFQGWIYKMRLKIQKCE